MKKLLLIGMFTTIVFSSSLLFSMNNDDQRRFIEFQGKKRTLYGLIRDSQKNTKHPFSTTSIIRYDGSKFIEQGDVLTLDEQDLNDIQKLNYVYCDFFCMQETRLSKMHVAVGALILGTRDETVRKELQNSCMDSMMN